MRSSVIEPLNSLTTGESGRFDWIGRQEIVDDGYLARRLIKNEAHEIGADETGPADDQHILICKALGHR